MNIYIAHTSKIDFKNELYKPIRESNLNNKYNFVFPHEFSNQIFDSKNFLKNKANLMIAEVSESSIGLWIEIWRADFLSLPIICIYKKDSKISWSLKIISKTFIEYSSSEELISWIEYWIWKFNY